MKVCLIGGGGFLGTSLAEGLVNKGYQVRVFSRSFRDQMLPNEVSSAIDWQIGDFGDTAAVIRALDGCDFAMHLVSSTLPALSNENPVTDLQENAFPTIELLRKIRRSDLKKIFFFSSGGTVYGIPETLPITETPPTNPICAYGIGKLTIEKYFALFFRQGGPDYTIVRLANPYGCYQRADRGQGIIAVYLDRMLQGRSVDLWGDGQVVRDYIHSDDVVDAIGALLNYEGRHKVFNLGAGQGHSVTEVIHTIEKVTGSLLNVRYHKSRAIDVPANVLDISKLHDSTGWSPKLSLAEGIDRSMQALRCNI